MEHWNLMPQGLLAELAKVDAFLKSFIYVMQLYPVPTQPAMAYN